MKTILAVSVFASLFLPVMSVAASVYEMPAVLVTAARMREEIKKEPQAVQIITGEEIRQIGAYNTTHAMQMAVGLNLSEAAHARDSIMGGNAVMLRGMNINHTLVLVDGRRLADEDTSQTHNAYILNRVGVHSIDRIEIVRGASSALYGSDAMGGVINIITKIPEKEGSTIGIDTGTREITNYYSYDTGKIGRWSSSFSAQFTKVRPVGVKNDKISGGVVYKGYDVLSHGPQQQFSLGVRYDFENINKNKLRFDFNYFNEEGKLSIADASMDIGIWRTELNKNEREYVDRKEFSTGLTYTGETRKNTYEFKAYYSRLKKDSRTYNDRMISANPFPAFGPRAKLHQKIETMRTVFSSVYPSYDYDNATYYIWGLDAADTLKADKHMLIFGGEYRKFSHKGTRLAESVNGIKHRGSYDFSTVAVFLSDLWQVSNRLYLTPALRFEYNNQFGSYTTPKLGLTYNLDDHTRFKANYGKGYKAPSISELYMRWNHAGNTINGNPDLNPEKSKSYDFSLEWERGKSFGKITYFNNKVKDLINTEHVRKNLYLYKNINRAQIRGTEMEIGKHISNRWTFKASHVYLDAKDKSNNFRLNNRAQNTFQFQFLYDDHKDYGYKAAFGDVFSNDYRFDGKNYSYNMVSASVRKKWGRRFSAVFALYNLLNKEVDDLYVTGREWAIGVEMKF